MSHLMQQIMKFGVVGVLAFFVDFGIYTACNFIGIHYLISGFLGFVVSVIFNYVLSMKFVFVRRDDISKTREFVTFVLLSIVGMGINELILYICMGLIYPNWAWMQETFSMHLAETLAKFAATGIVMVYNFITRKMFLESHDEATVNE